MAWGSLCGTAATAQEVLEPRPGAARLWSASGQAVDVRLDEARLARAGAAAEGGHVIAGEDLATADLFFLLASDGGVEELPVPPRAAAEERARPVLLTRNGNLDGAVWLEGSPDRGFAVVAAAWNGAGWETVETVAAANGRPQLAPAAAVLADGSWLAVWAGFDGGDDEIFWSRRRDGAWTPARRVHRDNRVPDVLPALTADGDGVLAAWSFYDGNDYRVRAARYDGSGWSVADAFDGRGGVDARWQKSAERSFVTYRTVEPEGWTVIELAAGGGIAHQLTVETAERRPPLVAADGSFGAPRLVWPYGPARSRR